jgi:hypothetical protein
VGNPPWPGLKGCLLHSADDIWGLHIARNDFPFHFPGTDFPALRLPGNLGPESFRRRPFSLRLLRKAAFLFKSPYLPNLPPMKIFTFNIAG